MPRTSGSGDIGARSKRGAHSDKTKERISASKKKAKKKKDQKERDRNRQNFNTALHTQQRQKEQEEQEEDEFEDAVEEDEVQQEPEEQYFFETWEREEDPEPVQCEDEDEDEEDDDHDDDKKKKFMDYIILAVQSRLTEEALHGKELEFKWLTNHVKDNNGWIRASQMRPICKRLKIRYENLPYYKDLFVWTPEQLWGSVAMPCCPSCRSNDNVRTKGYRKDVLGRRVTTLDDSYYMITKRYICKECESCGIEETQCNFNGWNETSLKLLPNGYQYCFPAIVSKKLAIDKVILDMMRPLFDKGIRLSTLQSLLMELHTKKYTKQNIQYNYKVKAELQMCRRFQKRRPNVKLLSEFGDCSRYDGFVPCRKYLKSVYISNHEKIKDMMDIEVKKRGAIRLFIDFSFKVGKHLWQYHGQRLFKGLCTGLNEHGECRIQFNTVTEDHQQMIPALEAMKLTATIFGQESVRLVTTDNPAHDKVFMQSMFEQLKTDEEKFNNFFAAEAETSIQSDLNMTCTVGDTNITYSSKKAQFLNKLDNLLAHVHQEEKYSKESPFVIGFDIESKVQKGYDGRIVGRGRTATIQLAYALQGDGKIQSNVFQIESRVKILPGLFSTLVTDDCILLVGVNLTNDLKQLRNDFGVTDETLAQIRAINLGKYARERGVVGSGSVGLQELVATVLKERMSKDPKVRFSDWTQTLTKEQIDYAALDAIKGLEIYNILKDKPDLSVRLKRNEVIPGTKVDIVPSHGNVACMMTRAAEGVILEDDSVVVPLLDSKQDTLKAGKNTRMVKITKVHAPGFIIPKLQKMTGGSITLGDYVETVGVGNHFVTRLNITMLKHHVDDDTILATQFGVPFNRTQPTQIVNNNVNTALPSPDNRNADEEEVDSDILTHETLDEEYIEDLDREAEAIIETNNLKGDDVQFLIDVLRSGTQGPRNPSLLKSKELGDVPEDLTDKYSSVLGDPFHLIDRPKIPLHHCYKKLFKVAFRDALLAWNPVLLEEVREAMKQDGLTDDDVDKQLYFNSKLFKACVDRRVLPSSLLYWRLRAVFMIFGNLKDTRTNQPLFNATAWKKAKNILNEVAAGLISDPPGVNFYVKRLNPDGTQMVNRYGFPLLESMRGSNRTESFHKGLITTFGNWVVGVIMSNCLIRERRHRHNHNVSEKRREGFPIIGHYDTWLIDELQMLVEQNFGVLLYPTWSNSSDYKETPESLGTVPLHFTELAAAVESIDIDMADVKLTPEQQFIAESFGTKFPFLPFDTIAERRKYIELGLETNTTDENVLSIDWCKYVNGKDIFPKLPVHFRAHKKVRQYNTDAKEAARKLKLAMKKMNELNEATLDLARMEQEDTSDADTPSLFLRPSSPLQIPIAQPQALHGRSYTYVGDTTICHLPAVDLPLIPAPSTGKKRGQRGVDKPGTKRRSRRCKTCLRNNDPRADVCKGRGPTGKCEHY